MARYSRRYRRLRLRGRRLRRRMRRRTRFRRRVRRARRGRTQKVSVVKDYNINKGSLMISDRSTEDIGIEPDSFRTWNIQILPPWCPAPGFSAYTGGWGSDGFRTTLIPHSSVQKDTTKWTFRIRDLPNAISITDLYNNGDIKRIWQVYKEYRIARVSVTLSVPEYNGASPQDSNRRLYVEWNHLPRVPTADGFTTNRYAFKGTTIPGVSEGGLYGWNWLWNMEDMARTCTISSHSAKGTGWHRKMLTAQQPVTISWRPRHADIKESMNPFLDRTGKNPDMDADTSKMTNYAQNPKFVRSYLPAWAVIQSGWSHWWTGPIVRLVDSAHRASEAFGTDDPADLFEAYGIRAHVVFDIKLRGLQSNDPSF